jgi:hypothetical protein
MLLSYAKMCKTFRIPRNKQITAAQFASMANGQVLQACRDLYNGSPLKLARQLEEQVLHSERGQHGLRAWLHDLRVSVYLMIVGVRRLDVTRGRHVKAD